MADNFSSLFATARDRRLFAATETTFGTQVRPSATDAFRAVGGGISAPQPNRIPRADNRPSRSVEALINGATPPASWSYECYLIPSGSLGTPPDVHALLMAVMGQDSYTNSGSTSDTYALTDTKLNRGSLSIYDLYPGGASTDKHGLMGEILFGAIASTMSIKGGGGDPPMITFGGVGASYRLYGRTTINDATPSGTTITMTDGSVFAVGGLYAFYEAADGETIVDDKSGTGWLVTAISGNDVTFDGTPGGLGDGDIVAPFVPTESVAGSPIPGIQTAMTVEGTSVSPLAWEINLENNDVPHDNEAGQSEMTGYHDNVRSLSGQFTYRLKASDMATIKRRASLQNTTIQIILGPGDDGDSLQIDAEVQMQVAAVEKAPEDTVIAVCPFTGVATSADAADELTLTFGNANP